MTVPPFLTSFGSPLGAVLHIPDERLAGARGGVAVGVKGVAGKLGHVAWEGGVERGRGAFIVREASQHIVGVGFAVGAGYLVLVVVGKGVVGAVVIVAFDIAIAVIVVGQIQAIQATIGGADMNRG